MNAPTPHALLRPDLATRAPLRQVLDAVATGVLVHDAQGLVVDCNAAAEVLLGQPRGVLLGRPAAALGWQPVAADGETPLDAPHPALQALAERQGRSDLIVTLRQGDGKPHWLNVSTRLLGTGSSATTATGVVCSLIDITGRQAMERELRSAAELDRLTGLPNRAQLLRRLQEAVQRAQAQPGLPLSVLFLDFDRFKLVNDTMGHDAGDELLVAVARRLREVLADGPYGNAFAARFGGDEFVIVAEGLSGADAAENLASRLIGVMAVPFVLKGNDFQSGVSIGIAANDNPADGAQELMRNADIAMYEAKRAGRRTWVVFDRAMHERLARNLALEAGLRLAVERGELSIDYQPIVDLETGRMSDVEALLRWHHPTLGRIDPDEFIPIAEESGHIITIGEWVLREACAQWQRWQAEDPVHAPAGVSVNLSRVQMALGSHLVTVVNDAIESTGMPPGALLLEITERELMKDPAAARELLLALASLQVRLALDDFGTGTSSLACLREHPFHAVKIHRSFVTGLSHDRHVLAVAHATVSVIENLGMASVAEGVETAAELATLQALGCRFGQGRLFAPPLPPQQVLAALQKA